MGITIGLIAFCAAGYFVWIHFLKRDEVNPFIEKGQPRLAASLEEMGDFETYSLDPQRPSRSLQFERDLKGSLVLLNFWASWCKPCVIETPDLLELASKNPSLKIIFVNEDSSQADLDAFLRSFPGMIGERTFVVRDHDRRLMKMLKVSLLPESHFYDKEGQFIRIIKGSIDWKTFKIE